MRFGDGACFTQEQTFAFTTGFTRTLNWAGFHCALLLAAAFAFWERRDWRMAGMAAAYRSPPSRRDGDSFPRYYFQLLPVMALMAARGYVLLGRKRAIVWLLLLIPLIRFGPRYVTLANDLLTHRETQWSDLALSQDSRAAADRIGHDGTLLVWGYRPDIFAYTRMPAGTPLS